MEIIPIKTEHGEEKSWDFQLGLSGIVWSVGVMTALIMLEP